MWLRGCLATDRYCSSIAVHLNTQLLGSADLEHYSRRRQPGDTSRKVSVVSWSQTPSGEQHTVDSELSRSFGKARQLFHVRSLRHLRVQTSTPNTVQSKNFRRGMFKHDEIHPHVQEGSRARHHRFRGELLRMLSKNPGGTPE